MPRLQPVSVRSDCPQRPPRISFHPPERRCM